MFASSRQRKMRWTQLRQDNHSQTAAPDTVINTGSPGTSLRIGSRSTSMNTPANTAFRQSLSASRQTPAANKYHAASSPFIKTPVFGESQQENSSEFRGVSRCDDVSNQRTTRIVDRRWTEKFLRQDRSKKKDTSLASGRCEPVLHVTSTSVPAGSHRLPRQTHQNQWLRRFWPLGQSVDIADKTARTIFNVSCVSASSNDLL